MKSIVIYYSLFGHTHKVAKLISKKLNADLLRIKPIKAYNVETAVIVGKKHIESKHSPKLKEYDFDAKNYDQIIIGSPVWWYSITPPIRTFIKENDFSGKKLIFFSTYGSSKGHVYDDAKELLGNIIDEKAFNSTKLNNIQKIKAEIDNWLSKVKKKDLNQQ